MSTIQQDMTDAAVVWEHLAKRLANEQGDGSDAAWDQATQIHAAATTLHGWADERKVKLRAAVDEDAPKNIDPFVVDEEVPSDPLCVHERNGLCYHESCPIYKCPECGCSRYKPAH